MTSHSQGRCKAHSVKQVKEHIPRTWHHMWTTNLGVVSQELFDASFEL